MTTVANASVVFKDKNGNVGTVKGASANDITKISNAISDVAQVVNPTTHLPINATTSSVGVVQLADSAAIAAGTSGRIVDAAQLKDAIEHVTPAGNVMTTDTAQTVTAVKTFSSLPESSVAPTTDNQLVNKKYVDDHATPLPSNLVTTDTAQTVSAVKTFTALPQSSVAPSASSDLVNKAYVDGQVDVNSTYTEPAVSKGILSPATNRLTPPSTAQELAIPQSRFLGETVISNVPVVDACVHLKDGALLNGAGSYAEFVEHIADIYTAGTSPDSFCTEADWQTSVTNYGFCNCFVYDSINNTVRLPKANSLHGLLIKSYSSGTSWYRIYEDGWCEQGSVTFVSGDATLVTNLLIPYLSSSYATQGVIGSMFNTAGDAGLGVYPESASTIRIVMGVGTGANTQWQASGYIDISDLQQSPIYEYIVVGTISKTDIQIDIDQVLTDLNGKADVDLSNTTPTSAFATLLNNVGIRTVVDTYLNGDSWYRVWSDGYCEQGGVYDVGSIVSGNYPSISLLKTLQTLTYADAICSKTNAFSSSSTLNSLTAKSAGLVDSSHIQIRCLSTPNDQTFRYIKWYVCGFTS